MPQFEFYNVSKDQLADWASGDYRWMLMKSGAFNPDDDVVSDLVPGTNELTVILYTRQPIDTPVRTVNDTDDSVEYACANPDFGDLTVGPEDATALVLIKVVTNDSDSLPVCWGDFTVPVSTGAPGVNPFVPDITDGLVGVLS